MGSMIKGDDSVSEWSFYSGGLGYELSLFFDSLLGYGTILFLAFTLLVFVIFFFNITEILSLKKATVEPSVLKEDEAKKQQASEPVNQPVESTSDESEEVDEEEEIDDSDWVVTVKNEESEPEESELEPELASAINLSTAPSTPKKVEEKKKKMMVPLN